MNIAHYIEINSSGVVNLCGERLQLSSRGSKMLVELYRGHVGDYPKFFKMDIASRLGFVASELLLNREGQRFSERDDRAVIFAGNTDCMVQDMAYLATIADKDNYFPSPALFVYTLPNIVTGEIAIRNRYMGETMYYALPCEQQLGDMVRLALQNPHTSSVLAAWLEVRTPDDFLCKMQIII